MTTFESEVKTIAASDEVIFDKLSDLSNLESVKDKLPQDKIKEFDFDSDSLRLTVDPVGKIGARIIERTPFKMIKFESEESPLSFNLWIQIAAINESSSKIKLTIKADINPFIKGMVSKPLQEGLNKMAEVIANIPYNS